MEKLKGRNVLVNRYSNYGVGRALQQKLRADKKRTSFELNMLGSYKK